MTAAVGVVGTAGLVAGCSSSVAAPAVVGSPVVGSSVAGSSVAGSSVAGSSVAGSSVSSSSAAPSSTTAAGPAPASSPAAGSPASLPGCRTAQLNLDAVREASANQQSFTTLVFRNAGGSACALSGFPGVTLLANGSQVGPDAQRNAATPQPVDLQPGQSAHARLAVLTSCEAPRADTVRVYPPNTTEPLTAPIRAYACSSEVSPVQPGSGG